MRATAMANDVNMANVWQMDELTMALAIRI